MSECVKNQLEHPAKGFVLFHLQNNVKLVDMTIIGVIFEAELLRFSLFLHQCWIWFLDKIR